MTDVVERYLDALTSHDWDGLRQCLHDDVVRVGPYNDEYVGRDAYAAFLEGLMPTLSGYSMEIERITYVDGRAYAQLCETVAGLRTDEAIVFDLVDDRITRVDVYIKTKP